MLPSFFLTKAEGWAEISPALVLASPGAYFLTLSLDFIPAISSGT
jgi:hypothetical protein